MLRFFRLDDPEHRRASDLLPWLLNDTLEGEERARVERHVAECVRCRRERDLLRTLQAAVASSEPDPAIDAAIARVRGRLDELEARPSLRLWRTLTGGWQESRPWIRALIAVQAVGLLGLAVTVLNGGEPAAVYHSLGSVSPRALGDAVVVVFRDDSTAVQIGGLLLRLHGRLVDGPNAAGAYTLQVPAGQRTPALAALRADPIVVFAEPQGGTGTNLR